MLLRIAGFLGVSSRGRSMGEVSLFDYAGLSVADQVAVQSAAVRIRDRMKRTVEDIIAIGQDLIAVKDKLPHGAFLPWIEAEFGMSENAARNFMRVATVYAGKSAMIADFSPTVLYELAAPSTPEPVRRAVEALAGAGESVSVAEVQRLKREATEAAKRAQDADAKANAAAAEAERQRAKADALAEGQRDLIEAAKAQARREAEEKAAAELETARAEAERAKTALAEQQRQLSDATRKAEVAAMAKAQAEAANLAAAELAKVQDAAKRAKEEEAKARAAVDRLSGNAQNLAARVREHEDYLRRMQGADVEAKAISQDLDEVARVLVSAMLTVEDMQHEHGEAVTGKARRVADQCRKMAQALDAICGPRLVYDAEVVG